MMGRRQRRERAEVGESSQRRCRRCGEAGHNSRTYKQDVVEVSEQISLLRVLITVVDGAVRSRAVVILVGSWQKCVTRLGASLAYGVRYSKGHKGATEDPCRSKERVYIKK